MSAVRKRITTAAVLAVAALIVAAGVSMSSADEPKAPKPSVRPRLDHSLPFPDGTVNSSDLQKAQEQMFRAMEALAKNPNDAEARKQMDEAQQTMMKVLNGGFPGAGVPNARTRERARLGVRLEPLTPLVTDQLGLEPGKGVAVAGVLDGSAAEKAGFKVHDIVTEFAGKPVTDPADFARRVSAVKAGEKVDAVVVRKGKRVELKGIDLPALPQNESALPTNPNAVENGRTGDSVSVSTTGDAFTINAVQEGVTYRVTGKTGDDGATVEKVSIKAGDETAEATALDKVPEKYRPTVEKLLKLVGPPRAKVRD